MKVHGCSEGWFLSLLGLPDFAWTFGRSIGLQCCLRKHWVRSSSPHSRLLCPVNNWGHSGNEVWQCDTEFLSLLHTLSEFNNQNRSNPSRESKICSTKKRWCKNQIRVYTSKLGDMWGICKSWCVNRPEFSDLLRFEGSLADHRWSWAWWLASRVSYRKLPWPKGCRRRQLFFLSFFSRNGKEWEGMDGMIGGKWSENER